jgi:hypothetical protein
MVQGRASWPAVWRPRERDGEGRKEGGGERWKMRRPLDSSAELGLGRVKKVCEGGVHRKSASPSWAAKQPPRRQPKGKERFKDGQPGPLRQGPRFFL